MLYGAKSLAADLVKPMIAAFDATYAGIVGVPRVAAMLAVFTMEYPLPPVSIIRFATAFITLNDPTTLMSITCATSLFRPARNKTATPKPSACLACRSADRRRNYQGRAGGIRC